MITTAPRLRRLLGGVVVTSTALLLSGCGTSFDAQTNQVYQAAVGSDERDSEIYSLNGLLVDNGDGTHTLSVALLDKIGESDELTGVTSTDERAEVEFGGPVELPADTLVKIGPEAEVVVRGDELEAGTYVDLELTFANAAPIETEVPVVERTDMYSQIATAPAQPRNDTEPDVDAEGTPESNADTTDEDGVDAAPDAGAGD